MNSLKYYVRRALGLPTWHYTPQHSIRASTHLPVLVGLARLFKIRNVLECGSGLYSTVTFLNRDLFSDLEHILSYETDPVWKARVEQATAGDPRLELVMSDDIARDLAARDLTRYDLVFVDNGTTGEERIAVIRRVATSANRRAVIVIHDIENDVYRNAAAEAGLTQAYISEGLNPFTGVFCIEPDVVDSGMKRRLKAWNRRAVEKLATAGEADIEAWIRVAKAETI
jgi:predicted O-methyltransferase YrrM